MFFGVDDTPMSQPTNRFAGEHYNYRIRSGKVTETPAVYGAGSGDKILAEDDDAVIVCACA